jgi:CelD/BcsL family acetyltransferase involved in cellulose biosynthesis
VIRLLAAVEKPVRADCRILTCDQLSADERALWREFSAEAPLAHPFYSFAFADAVSRSGPHVRICVFERGGSIEAFFPFQFRGRWERTLRAAEPIGGRMSDYFGITARPTFRVTPIELLTAARLDSLDFHHLPDYQLGLGLSGQERRFGHRILIGDNSADYWRRLRTVNKSFAAELDRRRRRVAETHGPLRFEFAVSNPVEKLKQLIADKRQQYSTSGVADALAESWKRELLIALARSTDLDCTGVLSELYAGDTFVAAHFGLRNHHTLHYWFPVYNKALSKMAPGHLLIGDIIDAGPSHGIRIIDRGEGDQPHKTAWLTERHDFYRGLWQRSGMCALAYRVCLAISWRLRMPRSGNGSRWSKKQPEGQ